MKIPDDPFRNSHTFKPRCCGSLLNFQLGNIKCVFFCIFFICHNFNPAAKDNFVLIWKLFEQTFNWFDLRHDCDEISHNTTAVAEKMRRISLPRVRIKVNGLTKGKEIT